MKNRLLQLNIFTHILIDNILLTDKIIIKIWSLTHCFLAGVKLITN